MDQDNKLKVFEIQSANNKPVAMIKLELRFIHSSKKLYSLLLSGVENEMKVIESQSLQRRQILEELYRPIPKLQLLAQLEQQKKQAQRSGLIRETLFLKEFNGIELICYNICFK